MRAKRAKSRLAKFIKYTLPLDTAQLLYTSFQELLGH